MTCPTLMVKSAATTRVSNQRPLILRDAAKDAAPQDEAVTSSGHDEKEKARNVDEAPRRPAQPSW
jgi:hypothetical protein